MEKEVNQPYILYFSLLLTLFQKRVISILQCLAEKHGDKYTRQEACPRTEQAECDFDEQANR